MQALFLYYRLLIKDCVEDEYGELVSVEPPKEENFGDFSTNIAMILAKKMGSSPMYIANDICRKLEGNDNFEKLEVKAPGFINWFVPKRIFVSCIPYMLQKDFGKSNFGNNKSVNVEYVSANPTGPIHAGHVRGAISGDVLAKLLDFVGYKVTKEFYVNDAGKQVDVLARSLYHRYLEQFNMADKDFPVNGYPGEYLIDIAKKIVREHGNEFIDLKEIEWLSFFKKFAISNIMTDIKKDLILLGVDHDVFSLESKLVAEGAVDRVVCLLKNNGMIYTGVLPRPQSDDCEEWEEREQLLFRSTMFGDDSDRPLQKSDGSWTYFASDIAYHMDKIDRGFDEIVDFWGADHGGYVKRISAAVSAISNDKVKFDVKLVQLVKLLKDGCEAKMSKRAGTFVTAKDIIDKVGKDVVRFIMLTRRNDAPLDFDFQKVIDQSRENPVFYVQYAYARTHSVIRMFKRTFDDKTIPDVKNVNLGRLDDVDIQLIKIMSDWPRQINIAAKKREPHRIAFFLSELASVFHSLWNHGNDSPLLRFIIPSDFEKTCARVTMLKSMQNVMELAFDIIGITPIEELK